MSTCLQVAWQELSIHNKIHVFEFLLYGPSIAVFGDIESHLVRLCESYAFSNNFLAQLRKAFSQDECVSRNIPGICSPILEKFSEGECFDCDVVKMI